MTPHLQVVTKYYVLVFSFQNTHTQKVKTELAPFEALIVRRIHPELFPPMLFIIIIIIIIIIILIASLV